MSKYTYTMAVTYEAASGDTPERIRMLLKMPDQMWFAIGFGSSMTNTDMIAWHSNGKDSYVQDYWSTSKAEPKLDDSQDVTNTGAFVLPADDKTNY